jgi:curved DNA-binding protein CbpA
MDDPYKVLGVEPGVDLDRIGRAYRTLVRRYPPELNPERFARIQSAYDLLRSLGRRMEEAYMHPEATLEALFPPPRLTLKPPDPPPAPLQEQDLEPLLRPLRRALLETLLREGFLGEPSPHPKGGMSPTTTS